MISRWNDEVVWRYMETFSILYWICCHPSMQYHALFQHSSTTTISWRQGSCLQGRGSKQIRNLLTGPGSWLPMLFFWFLNIFGRFYCVVSSVLTIWKGLKGPLVDTFPLLVSSSKTVMGIRFWLDLVRLGSVAKLLQQKSFCKRLSSINLPDQLH